MSPFSEMSGLAVFDSFQMFRMVKKNRYFSKPPERYGLFYVLFTCTVNILPAQLLKAKVESSLSFDILTKALCKYFKITWR